MAIVVKHGSEAHVMRPDGVMRTGVLQPFTGYSPQTDARAVASAFIASGPLATQLSGLGANPLRTWWENFRARFVNRKAKKAVIKEIKAAIKEAVQAEVTSPSPSPGPEMDMGSQVAPQMRAQMQMLHHLTQDSNSAHARGPLARAMATLEHRRPFTFYRAG